MFIQRHFQMHCHCRAFSAYVCSTSHLFRAFLVWAAHFISLLFVFFPPFPIFLLYFFSFFSIGNAYVDSFPLSIWPILSSFGFFWASSRQWKSEYWFARGKWDRRHRVGQRRRKWGRETERIETNWERREKQRREVSNCMGRGTQLMQKLNVERCWAGQLVWGGTAYYSF